MSTTAPNRPPIAPQADIAPAQHNGVVPGPNAGPAQTRPPDERRNARAVEPASPRCRHLRRRHARERPQRG